MNKAAIFLCVLASVAITLNTKADEVTIGTIEYQNVTITKVTGRLITFTAQGGNDITKAVKDITYLNWSGHTDLNAAERLMQDKKVAPASLAYNAAIDKTANEDEKDFLKARLAKLSNGTDKQAASSPAVPAAAIVAPVPSASATERCYFCNNTGKMLCSDCKGAGKCKCTACVGMHKVVCPACNGRYVKDCTRCNGAGSMEIRVYDARLQSYVPRSAPCTGCGGLRQIYCPRCKSSSVQGKVECPTCHGTGLGGQPCSTCTGSGKLPCVKCSAGQNSGTGNTQAATPAVVTAVPAGASEGGVSAEPPKPAAVSALTSLDALAASLLGGPKNPEEDPGWSRMTALQKDAAKEKYEEERKNYKPASLKNAKIEWRLFVNEINLKNDGSIVLIGYTEKGNTAHCTYSPDFKKTLTKFSKSDAVIVGGVLEDAVAGSVPGTIDTAIKGSTVASGTPDAGLKKPSVLP